MWGEFASSGAGVRLVACLLLIWSAADALPLFPQRPGATDVGSTLGDPYNAGAASIGSDSSRSGRYQLHLGPLASAGVASLQLEDLVFAIATHSKKEANVFAGRPFRLVRQLFWQKHCQPRLADAMLPTPLASRSQLKPCSRKCRGFPPMWSQITAQTGQSMSRTFKCTMRSGNFTGDPSASDVLPYSSDDSPTAMSCSIPEEAICKLRVPSSMCATGPRMAGMISPCVLSTQATPGQQLLHSWPTVHSSARASPSGGCSTLTTIPSSSPTPCCAWGLALMQKCPTSCQVCAPWLVECLAWLC